MEAGERFRELVIFFRGLPDIYCKLVYVTFNLGGMYIALYFPAGTHYEIAVFFFLYPFFSLSLSDFI